MIVLRTRLHSSILILTLLTLALAGCSFTTDTVATVGGERITVGELNAAMARAGASESDRRAVLDQLIAGRLLELEARSRNITLSEEDIRARIEADRQSVARGTPPGGEVIDTFTETLRENGITSGSDYRTNVRQRLLLERLRPQYIKPVEAVTLQLLVAPNRERAQEALARGRAGVPFDELVREYAAPNLRDERTVNAFSNQAVDSLPKPIRDALPEIREGVYSEPFQVSTGGQYAIVRVAKIERRDPLPNEENSQIRAYLDSLRQKYPVNISPDLSLPPEPAR